MSKTLLELTGEMHLALWRHLLREDSDLEEAAFVYARREGRSDGFRGIEWCPVPPEGFISRSEIHFELTDEMRGSVIKRAHDLQASLVEFHSHTGPWPAAFSPSDVAGFREFVPHVWWRLKEKPYLAIVVSRTGFDGFAWVNNPQVPGRLDGLLVNERFLIPSGLSKISNPNDYE